MAWKNLPAWLKGGIIGAIIIFIVNLISLFIIKLGYSMQLFFFIDYPALFLSDIFNLGIIFQGWQAYLILFIFLPLFYFIIGTIIGWIVGKFKSKIN
ncbi:MAG: hypothetical protein ACOYT4_04115 [Nanoarchaeota archaeon]